MHGYWLKKERDRYLWSQIQVSDISGDFWHSTLWFNNFLILHLFSLTLTLLEPKIISLCHQNRARPDCTSVQSDQTLVLLANQLQVIILISRYMILDSSNFHLRNAAGWDIHKAADEICHICQWTHYIHHRYRNEVFAGYCNSQHRLYMALCFQTSQYLPLNYEPYSLINDQKQKHLPNHFASVDK